MLRLFRQLRSRLRNRDFDDDLAEELRFHEELKRQELEASGMRAEDARSAARRALGNMTLMREESRGVWIAPWLESLVQDARYAVRTLARQPLHTTTSIVVLVLGIGLNTSLFSTFKGTALAPWPGRDPDRLVRIRAVDAGREIAPSFDEYRLLKELAASFSGVAAYQYGGGSRIRVGSRSETYPQTYFVSSGFFDVLGARLQLGAGFIPEDDQPGGRRTAAIISHQLWQNYLGGDPTVVGTDVTIDGTHFTITGVLEQGIDGLSRDVDLWLPFSTLASLGPVMQAGIDAKGSGYCCIDVVGRLADGVSVSRARREVQLLHERFAAATKRKSGVVQVYGTAYASAPDARDLQLFTMLGAAVGLLLVLACANVGNLHLARGLARRREIATRLAIGASRLRIVRQLMVEGLVLSFAAGALSIAFSASVPGVILGVTGEEIPPGLAGRMMPDVAVVAFTAAVCLVACVAFALAPAFHATRRSIPLAPLDRSSTRATRFPLRGALLALQIAVCTVLLAGAGLLTRAVDHALTFDPGFRIHDITRVAVSLPSDTPAEQTRALTGQVLSELERHADQPIALSSPSPLAPGSFFEIDIIFPGEAPGDSRPVDRRSVSVQYFDVLGIPLISGRTFSPRAADEAVVNEAFVRSQLRGEDPIGRVLREVDTSGAVVRSYTIVGVVRDAWLTGLERIEPVLFRSATSGVFVTRGGPAAVERIRAAATGLDASASVRAWPLTDELEEDLESARAGATLAWCLGLLGLLLATVGVFGVFAYAVEERRREIGVRLALGAARAQITRMLISTSGRSIALGLGVGILLSLACGPLLRSYLYGLSPVDPIAYGMVLALLGLAAALATFVPARRACSVDPAVTLREE